MSKLWSDEEISKLVEDIKAGKNAKEIWEIYFSATDVRPFPAVKGKYKRVKRELESGNNPGTGFQNLNETKGSTKKGSEKWSEEEITKLEDLVIKGGLQPGENWVQHFPNRSHSSVASKACRVRNQLGISTKKEPSKLEVFVEYSWTIDEIKLIVKSISEKKTRSEISDL